MDNQNVEAKPSVIILVQYKYSESGNYVTAARIRSSLELKDYHCEMINVRELDYKEVSLQLSKCNCVLVLHALHGEAILRKVRCPYIVIFGGTDVYQHAADKEMFRRISQVVHNAAGLVCFTQDIFSRAKELWMNEIPASCIYRIPQAVSLPPVQQTNGNDNILTYLSSAGIATEVSTETNSKPIIFLLPAGLRPVKDVLQVVTEFCAWSNDVLAKTKQLIYLVIIGPVVDATYAKLVKKTIDGIGHVFLVPPVARSVLLTLVMDEHVKAVCNTSISEGQSAVILESMYCGVPVIVRGNAGNTSIVQHLDNGFVYNTPKEFVSCCERLLAMGSEELSAVTRAAREYVAAQHSCRTEAHQYHTIISKLLRTPHASHHCE